MTGGKSSSDGFGETGAAGGRDLPRGGASAVGNLDSVSLPSTSRGGSVAGTASIPVSCDRIVGDMEGSWGGRGSEGERPGPLLSG